jgi:hypothetical protein
MNKLRVELRNCHGIAVMDYTFDFTVRSAIAIYAANGSIKEKSMKVYWWQAGLHFEPENESDSTALLVLSESLKLVQQTEQVDTGPISGDLGNYDSVGSVHVAPKMSE